MWNKVILALVLVTFVVSQLADALTCYSCNSPTSCENPTTQICDDTTANASSVWLNTIHSDVPVISTSKYFRCVSLQYYLNGLSEMTHQFSGCYHPEIEICDLTLNVTTGSTTRRKCDICDKNFCNPAGTFSKSGYTIIATIMALFVAKVLI